MDKDERHKMVRSMMMQFFAGMDVDEKKELFATMMNGMCAGINMYEGDDDGHDVRQ